jgi:hypothetical protein
MQKQITYLRLSTAIADAMKTAPISGTQLINTTIREISQDPTAIGKALNKRLDRTLSEVDKKTTYNLDIDVASTVSALSDRFGISGEELIRLAIEAYLIKTNRL